MYPGKGRLLSLVRRSGLLPGRVLREQDGALKSKDRSETNDHGACLAGNEWAVCGLEVFSEAGAPISGANQAYPVQN